jgi:hypothetical protein
MGEVKTMTKYGKNRTNIYLPEALKEEAKKRGINLSKFFTKMLEYELYQDNPKFIEQKLKELNDTHSQEETFLCARLEEAKKKDQTKKQRLSRIAPEAMDYRTITPKKEGK